MLPLVPTAPGISEPVELQDVELSVDHVSVADCPEVMVLGVAVNVSVGAACAGDGVGVGVGVGIGADDKAQTCMNAARVFVPNTPKPVEAAEPDATTPCFAWNFFTAASVCTPKYPVAFAER